MLVALVIRERDEETCNFRQFVRTLAHFRPIDSATENLLNSREKKMQCKWNSRLHSTQF